MCVICYKKKSQKLPTEKTLKKMWDTNPDGGGIMWIDKGKVKYAKGFMKFDDFILFLKANKSTLDKSEVAIHFRITTHGGTTQGNTHPFPITGNCDRLHDLIGVSDCVVAHNGILSIKPRQADISDTGEMCIRAFESGNPLDYLKTISDYIYGNRVIVFTPDGAKFFGDDFVLGKDGLLYSNLNHENPPKSWWLSSEYTSTAKGENDGDIYDINPPFLPDYLSINCKEEEEYALDIIQEICDENHRYPTTNKAWRKFYDDFCGELCDWYYGQGGSLAYSF